MCLATRRASAGVLSICLTLGAPTGAVAEEADILEMLGSERAVIAATGYAKPVSQAPSVASVVTAADIRAMGATMLDQVLETVPGVHMSTSRDITSLPIIRGITSELNADVLVLLNGIPYGQSLTNTFAAFDNFPVSNVERVEVLRGPVSALYGADAFAGVINIVTKTAEDIRGTEVSALAGSFDTYQGSLLHGGHWGPFDVALSITGRTTHGFEGTVEADGETRLDRLFHTHASLAPGAVSTGRDIVDARLDVSSGPWRARVGYFGQHLGMGAGFLEALDPQGQIDIDRTNADLTYRGKLTRHFELTGLVSYYRNDNRLDARLLPPGTFAGVPPGFPDGVRDVLATTESQWRGQLSVLYSGMSEHMLHGGLGYFHSRLGDISEQRNYQLLGPLLAPTGRFASTQALGIEASLPPSDRDVLYAFAQDEWYFAPDWTLTTGLRADRYSDIGTTLNPRVSLVWQARYNLTTRLLYGRAFRAPSFFEKSLRDTPVAVGNPHLDAETIDMLDLAFDSRWARGVRTRLDLFWYQIHDRIETVPIPNTSSVTFVNGGDTRGYGLEIETVWKPARTLEFKASYAFQHARDEATDHSPGLAPQHQVYFEADWEFSPKWHFDTSVKSVLDRERAAGDARAQVPDFSLVGLTLRRLNIGRRLDVSFSVRNLLDADAREPSRSGETLPGDLPLAGRNIYGELIYHF